MAKIQYIRSSGGIEFETPAGYGVAPVAAKKTDPALKVFLSIGVVGFLLAVVALLIAIVSLQSKNELRDLLIKSNKDRAQYAVMLLGEKMSTEARAKLDDMVVAVLDLNETGVLTDKKLSNFLDSVWEQIMEKETGLPLTITIVQQAMDLTLEPDSRLKKVAEYFEEGDELDILEGSFVEVSEEGEMLFAPPSEFETPGMPEAPVGPEGEEIPDYIN